MLEIVALFFVSIIIRFGPVLKSNTGFDTYGHLYFTKEVKNQKAGPFGKISTKVAGSNGFKSQFLWHWLLGFLKIDKISKLGKWINPFFDVVFTLILYVISINFGLDSKSSIMLAGLYLCTPMWFSSISPGPRVNSLTPRLSSEIATNLFFIITMLPLGIPYIAQLVLGTILSAFVILSFRFGLQAVFLITPLVSLFTFNLKPLISVIAAIILSIFISRGDFIETLKYQYVHLRWYFFKNLKGEMTISNRNSLERLKSAKDRKGLKKKIYSIVKTLLSSNSFTGVFLKMPVFVFSIIGIITVLIIGSINVIPPLISSVVVAGAIIFIVVNIPIFLFIGEAERYLNHIAYFILLSAVLIADYYNIEFILYSLILYGLIYWFIESFFLKNIGKTDIDKNKDAEEVFEYLKHSEKKIILAFPYHVIGGVWRIMLDTEHEVVCHMASDGEYRNKLEEKYSLTYPYLNLNLLEEISDEYGVNFLIIDNKHLKLKNLQNWSPPDNWFQKSVSGDYFSVFEKESKS